MIPWLKLDAARGPDGAEISLWRRGDEIVVRAGGADLMSNRCHGSEDALAELGCAGLPAAPVVLVGGLGMGFTLRAALAVLPPGARVVVAEIFPAVVEWLRGPIGRGDLLDDPRVSVEPRDAAEVLRESEARFDAVLLDADNGPAALTIPGNVRLYSRAGLAAAHRALRPGGRLAVWSAGDDTAFTARLHRAGFAARAERVRADVRGGRGRGARHVIFIGER